ncbi:unnamed protein product, partial [Ectocarpus sp. 4 AP-2014]
REEDVDQVESIQDHAATRCKGLRSLNIHSLSKTCRPSQISISSPRPGLNIIAGHHGSISLPQKPPRPHRFERNLRPWTTTHATRSRLRLRCDKNSRRQSWPHQHTTQSPRKRDVTSRTARRRQ